MRKRFKIKLTYLFIAVFCFLLLFYTESAVSAVSDGIILCTSKLIPSLFPFFVLSSLCLKSGFADAVAGGLSSVISPVFGISGYGAVPLITAFIGGYPIGAKIVSGLYTDGKIEHKEAERLMMFTCNTGPAFIIGAAGIGVFSSFRAGMILYISHIVSALLYGIILRLIFGKVKLSATHIYQKTEPSGFSEMFTNSVTDSFSAMLNVCAFVIIFCVFNSFIECSGILSSFSEFLCRLGLRPAQSEVITAGFLELSSGIAKLNDIACDLTLSLPTASFLLSWGGICVHFQTLSYTAKHRISSIKYILSKLFCGFLSGFITYLIVRYSFIQPVFSFIGHANTKSFIYDYLGLFFSLACAVMGTALQILSIIRGRKRKKAALQKRPD